jgi:hypothetical protein
MEGINYDGFVGLIIACLGQFTKTQNRIIHDRPCEVLLKFTLFKSLGVSKPVE